MLIYIFLKPLLSQLSLLPRNEFISRKFVLAKTQNPQICMNLGKKEIEIAQVSDFFFASPQVWNLIRGNQFGNATNKNTPLLRGIHLLLAESEGLATSHIPHSPVPSHPLRGRLRRMISHSLRSLLFLFTDFTQVNLVRP